MTCAHCGGPIPAGRTGRYCSDSHRKRAWDQRHATPCEACGGPVADPRARRCSACGPDPASPQRLCALERREQIQRMWARGATAKQIAAELGTTENAINTQIAFMRRAGWAIPYRREAAA